MRGAKSWAYEGGHRVPFFIRCPRIGIDGGRDFDMLCANIDVMPTLLDLCGAAVPSGRTFHGTSLAPLLRNEKLGIEDRIIITDSQRVPRPIKWRKSCAMRGKWRLINGRELYDVAEDPAQRVDVAAEHPDVVERLREEPLLTSCRRYSESAGANSPPKSTLATRPRSSR